MSIDTQKIIVLVVGYLLFFISVVCVSMLIYKIIKKKYKHVFILVSSFIISFIYLLLIRNNIIIWKEIDTLKPLQNARISTTTNNPEEIQKEFDTMFGNWLNRSLLPPKIGVKIITSNIEDHVEIYSYGYDFDDDNGKYNNQNLIYVLLPFYNGDILIQKWDIKK